MKTHDIARVLTALAKTLRSLPDSAIEELPTMISRGNARDSANTAISLSTLAQLSAYGKSEWIEVIRDFDLPIEVRPRDASRDVLGKLLNYLEQNKEERERISREARARSKSSSEVTSALQFLLRNG